MTRAHPHAPLPSLLALCSISRDIDTQSSEAGAFNPDCPGRLHGGDVVFPPVFEKVETKHFPATKNPCAKEA